MDGKVLFQDALSARLKIIQPSRQDVHTFLAQRPFQLTKGVKELIDLLHAQGKVVYLVSGGFRQVCLGVCILRLVCKDPGLIAAGDPPRNPLLALSADPAQTCTGKRAG